MESKAELAPLSSEEKVKMTALYQEIKEWLQEEVEKAKSEEKPLLLVTCDKHSSKSALFIQACILLIAQEMGIKDLHPELRKDYDNFVEGTLFQTKQNVKEISCFGHALNFRVWHSDLSIIDRIDLLRRKEEDDIIIQKREKVIHQSILEFLNPVIAIFGGFHAKSFFENPEIREQFHLACLNSYPAASNLNDMLIDFYVFLSMKVQGLFDKGFSSERFNFIFNKDFTKQIDFSLPADISIAEIFEQAKKCANELVVVPSNDQPIQNSDTVFGFFSRKKEELETLLQEANFTLFK
ncbi:TPA: hypothetical protein ACTXXA_000944 [Legionella anisa]